MNNNKKALLAIVLVLVLVCLFSLSGCQKKAPSYTQISIQRDGNYILTGEINVLVGDTFTLSAVADDNSTPSVTWQSSKSSVATVSSEGYVVVEGEGTTIITACETSSGHSYSDSIFVNASLPVEQLGVGSGESPDDPIFLGNEGSSEPLEIYFIEMTQIYADAVFIKKGNVEVLFDAGYEIDGENVNSILREKVADDRLDLFMVSHSDGDHINGISNALDGIENISLMIDYGGVGTGNVKATREKYIPLGMTYHSAYDCVNGENGAFDRYYLTKDLYVDILNTGNYILNTDSSASNPHSVASIFTYKDFKFFEGGDLTESSEISLMKNEALPEVTLYKAAHHGSHGSNSQSLLDTLNPKAIAISAARASSYGYNWTQPDKNVTYNLNAASGHPAQAAIERFYKAPRISQNLNVYWNAVNGTMKFTTYGEDNFVFEGSATIKGYYDLTLTDGKAVWNEELQDFENRVVGEENFKLHQSKVFVFRGYISLLPQWAQREYFPDYVAA